MDFVLAVGALIVGGKALCALTQDALLEDIDSSPRAGLIPKIETLGKAQDRKARQLLVWVAREVEPLMKKHKLEVPVLREMMPESPNHEGRLRMGFNRLMVAGAEVFCQQIQIALRPYDQMKGTFYSKAEILDTMIHELAHNTIQGHPPAFWRLMEQYKQELDDMKAGRDRFPGKARTLGGSEPWGAGDPRKRAAAAARKRAVAAGEAGRASAGSPGPAQPWGRQDEAPDQARQQALVFLRAGALLAGVAMVCGAAAANARRPRRRA